MKPKPICNLCHSRPSEYDKVNHCKECHRAYCRARYELKFTNKRMVLRSNVNRVRYWYACIGEILTLERKEVIQDLIKTRRLEIGMVNHAR